jgi:hypothetical protein
MAIHDEFRAERARQDEEWGGAAHDDRHSIETWIALLTERVGQAFTGYQYRDRPAYRQRLIQTTALAIAAAESLDRQEAVTRRVRGS